MDERVERTLLVIAAFAQLVITAVASDATVPAWLLVATLLALAGTVLFYRSRVAEFAHAPGARLGPELHSKIDQIDGLLRALPGEERMFCPWQIADAYNRLVTDAFAGQTFVTLSGQQNPVPPEIEQSAVPSRASIRVPEARALLWELRAKLAPGHPPPADLIQRGRQTDR